MTLEVGKVGQQVYLDTGVAREVSMRTGDTVAARRAERDCEARYG